MRIGVLGTGSVGQALGTALAAAGHEVSMGARSADNPAATAWAAEQGAQHGTFADAAAYGEVLVNATAGTRSLEALTQAGAEQLDGTVLVDVANALDHSVGFPPALRVGPGESLAEQIAAAFPRLRVVKTLNTMNAAVMADPARVPGEHTVFVAGDDAEAKAVVRGLLRDLGWPDGAVLDLGDLTAARGMEAYMPLWLSLVSTLGTSVFNIAVRTGED